MLCLLFHYHQFFCLFFLVIYLILFHLNSLLEVQMAFQPHEIEAENEV